MHFFYDDQDNLVFLECGFFGFYHDQVKQYILQNPREMKDGLIRLSANFRHINEYKIVATFNCYGLLHGFSKLYIDGVLFDSSPYKDDYVDGTCKEYYPSGKLKSSRSFKKGLANGVWKEYDKGGRLVKVGSYRHDKEHGTFFTYGSNGRKLSRTEWDYGRKISETKYFPENVKMKGPK